MRSDYHMQILTLQILIQKTILPQKNDHQKMEIFLTSHKPRHERYFKNQQVQIKQEGDVF